MPTLFDQLLGPWELVSYQLELDPGRTAHPLGEDAVGPIVYTPQRPMSVNIMRPGRATWASPNPAAGTQSDTAEAAAESADDAPLHSIATPTTPSCSMTVGAETSTGRQSTGECG